MSIEKNVKQNFSTEKVCSFCQTKTIRTFLKPVIDLQGTGAQIRRLRKINGFSVHELQQIFGFEYPQAIYAWEAGKNAPTIDNLLVLAQLFKVDISEIVVSATIEVSLPCSEHAASCMNDQGACCEQCRFKKSA